MLNLTVSLNVSWIKHKIRLQIITINVLKHVAKFELTFLIPTLANIVVNEVKIEAIKANNI